MEIDYAKIRKNVDKYIERNGDPTNLGSAHYAKRLDDVFLSRLIVVDDTLHILQIWYRMQNLRWKILDKYRIIELPWFMKLFRSKKEDPVEKLVKYMEFQESEDAMFNREYLPYTKNCFAFEVFFDLMKVGNKTGLKFGFDDRLIRELERIPEDTRDPMENRKKQLSLEKKVGNVK